MPIDLTPPQKDTGIDLNEETPVAESPAAIEQDIEKAVYSVGHILPEAQIRNTFWLRQEDRMRSQLHVREQMEARQAKLGAVQRVALDAAREGRSLDEQEREFIMQMGETEVQGSTDTILERLYAKRMTEDFCDPGEGLSHYLEAAEEAPEDTEETRTAAEAYLAKQEIVKTRLAKLQDKLGEQSWIDTGFQFMQGLLPGYSWLQTQDATPNVSSDGFFAGDNLENQYQSLYFQDTETFAKNFNAAVDGFDNTLEALRYAEGALSYSGKDTFLDNAFSAMDTLDVATFGLGAAMTASKLFRSQAKAVVRGNANPVTTKAAREVLTGDINRAAETQAITKIDSVVPAGKPSVDTGKTPNRPTRGLKELLAQGQTLLDPRPFFRDASHLSNEQTRRLIENVSRNRDLLISTMTDVGTLTRISAEAAARGFQKARRDFMKDYNKLEDAIVDIRNVRESEEIFGGVDRIDVLLGTKEATGFVSPNKAEFFAKKFYRLAEGSYDVVEESGSYFLRMSKTIDETDLGVMDLRIGTDNVSPDGMVNYYLGWLTGADNTNSDFHNMIRKQATYGGNAVMGRIAEVTRQMGTLGKNERKRLHQIMDSARFKYREITLPDGTKTQVQGRFYNTVGELTWAYKAAGHGWPSEKEVEAYFNFRMLMDWDHTLKNVGIVRDKARLGIEQKQFGFAQIIPPASEGGKPRTRYVMSDFIEGRSVDALPTGSKEPFTVGWVNPKTGKMEFSLSNNNLKWKNLEEALDSGNYKIIQVANQTDPKLRNVVPSKGEPVQYLVVKDVKTKPLSFNQVPYNEGGHWIYPHQGSYLKQARTHKTGFGRRVYDGDVTAHYFPSRAMGAEFEEAYETARRLLNDPAGLDRYVQRHLPYQTGADFAKLFRTADNPDAPFDPDTPFVLAAGAQKAGDVRRLDALFGEEIVDTSTSSHSLVGKINHQFTQERGERLSMIEKTGGNQNPVFSLRGAPIMDSGEALARSAAMMSKNRFFDDYKHSAVENWATEFADVTDISIEELMADPIRHLKDPKFNNSGNKAKIAAAKNVRRNILQILGTPTKEDEIIQFTRQQIVDSVYGRTGGKGVDIVDPLLWDRKTDATTIVRSFVFHLKLGLFNIVQLPLQAAAVAHAVAIDGNPVRAAQSLFLYQGMRLRGLTPDGHKAHGLINKHLSKALGVSEDKVEEAFALWHRTGANVVSGEVAQLDDYINPGMFHSQGVAGKALDVGLMPFKEGNNIHRGVSFVLSYLKWREANPTKVIRAADEAQILQRMDLMYVNMSRASNAQWQKGIGSIPTQFFAYHARLTEQMLGKRLTHGERFRLMGFYSLLYGVPIGVGGSALGAFFPMGESIKQALMENNIDTDANLVTKVLTDGALDTMTEMFVGTEFDIGERIGPAGLSWAKDLFLDGKFLEVLGGASTNSLSSNWSVAQPFLHASQSVFASESDRFDLTWADVVDVLREASSQNNLVRAYQVFTLGQWLTKNEGLIADVPEGDWGVAAMVALGFAPSEVSEAYMKLDTNKKVQEAKNAISNEAIVQFERGLKAAKEGDQALTEKFFKRAKLIMESGGFTPMERAAVWDRVMGRNQSMLEDVDQTFMMQDPKKRNPAWIERQNERMEMN